jgi:transcriptional coactivator p15 (PC4)
MGQVIYEIKRNNSEIIRIDVSEFKGKNLINIRIWYQAQDYNNGELVYKPTQKGVTLDLSLFDELKTGIDKLAGYVEDLKKDEVPDQPDFSKEVEDIKDDDDEDEKDEKDDEKKSD